ncbi:MAG: glutathione S-transferase family protein [Rhodospirillaceae bacterium]
MGLLVDGLWVDKWYDTKSSGGKFQRAQSQFRHSIAADGSSPFAPEEGRYHLYVSYACPWAHRTLIYRALKGLEHAISVSVVDPLMLEEGWTLSPGADPLFGATRLHQVYTRAQADYSGRVTVPVLWDKHSNTIVNNESAEIIRLFDEAFGAVAKDPLVPDTLRPVALRDQIDALNAEIYDAINNGVYKAGFATTQAAYQEAVTALFAMLDRLEDRLSQSRYLLGDQPTEADWRLFPTLIRFDPVYVGHFKCGLRRIVDYPNLWGYLRDLYGQPGIAATVHMDHIKDHYYASHRTINPTGIVPIGPDLDYSAPHGRGGLPS